MNTGAHLLDQLHGALTRYAIFPSPEAADAAAVWTAATHAQPAWEHAPRLVVTSPVKQCGKSRVLDVIEATCNAPLMTVNISVARLVHSIGTDPPTLLLDEADTVFGRKSADNHEDLRGILNAGHQRNRPYGRWNANTRQPEDCPSFAMAALATIGSLPDTIEDRAVILRMRRRAQGECVAPFRTRRDGPPLHALRDQLHKWARSNTRALTRAEPVMPVEDRAADTWEPLCAIADAAGGDWPERIRCACLVLTSQAQSDPAARERVLADLRGVFGAEDAMHTADILDALRKIDEAPWGQWYGRELTARDLAGLLRPFGISPADVKLAGINKKGYRRDQLHDAWRRYLAPSATSATSATAQHNGQDHVAGSGWETLPATGNPPLTSGVVEVAEVADTPQE